MLTAVVLLTAANLRAALRQPAGTVTLMLSAAVVVGATTSMAALARGLYAQLAGAGSPDRAVVLESGARAVVGSVLSAQHVEFVYQAAGAARASGVDRLVVAGARLVGKHGGVPELVAIRGITPEGLEMRPDFRVEQGRMFETGRYEAVAGAHASTLFRNAGVGDRLTFGLGHLEIVGTFETGDHLDSVFLVDADTVFGRRCQAMVVDLDSAESFNDFEAALLAHPTLDFGMRRESDYFEEQAWIRSEVFREVGLALGAIMAIGGVFCTMNVMVSAVAMRRSETATLRAVGFAGSQVAAAALLEAVAIVVVGAVAGAVASWVLLDGVVVREGGSYSVSFRPVYDVWTLGHGVLWAILLMFGGGLFATRRMLRDPIRHGLAAAER